MQAVATSSPITANSSVPAIEYSLRRGRNRGERGLEVSDRTNRMAKVVFSQELTDANGQSYYEYEILVNEKQVIEFNSFKLNAFRCVSVLTFIKSSKISFQLKGDFVEVTETDKDTKEDTIVYINYKNATWYIDFRELDVKEGHVASMEIGLEQSSDTSHSSTLSSTPVTIPTEKKESKA